MSSTRLIFLIFLFPAMAQAADWRFIGQAMIAKEKEAQFYDAENVEHLSGATTRVWVTSVAQKTLDNYIKKHSSEKQFMQAVGKKISTGYVPDFTMLPGMKELYLNRTKELNDLGIDLTMQEMVVNFGDVQPTAKIYFEIDCTGNRIEILSTTEYRANGSVLHSGDVTLPKYNYIAPDTNSERLSQMLCTNR